MAATRRPPASKRVSAAQDDRARSGAPRITSVNDAPVRPRGDYVLYWMIAARRAAWSFALDHAAWRCVEFGRPLVVFEPLRAGYRWASDRLHAFVIDGMRDNARDFAAAGVTYVPYVEPQIGAGAGLLAALGKRACVVVTDEQPGFFLPRMVEAAGKALAVRLEQVDGNGLLPLRASDRAFATAAAFRRHFHRSFVPALPAAEPLGARVLRGGEVAGAIVRRWRPAALDRIDLAALPIDHTVRAVPYAGGSVAARAALDRFLAHKLARYADDHSDPDADGASGLSPYLHFGHVSACEIAARIWRAARWDPSQTSSSAVGRREGWWGLPAATEAFLDELITWRELSYGHCFHRADHARWSALPAWAQRTLEAHARDPRTHVYTRAELAQARTADALWNAAQRQLLGDGRIQNYLRMLWGKKILEWSQSPQAALATLIALNDRYAVDGRDPNSYAGILWTLGLFDRPWGPERPIFGTVRYMSSDNTARKHHVRGYLARWGGQPA